jgi:hypothetical protein
MLLVESVFDVEAFLLLDLKELIILRVISELDCLLKLLLKDLFAEMLMALNQGLLFGARIIHGRQG